MLHHYRILAIVLALLGVASANSPLSAQTPKSASAETPQKTSSKPKPSVCIIGTVKAVYMLPQPDGSINVSVTLKDPENSVYLDFREARRVGLVVGGSATKRGQASTKSSVDIAVSPLWRLSLDCPLKGRPYSVVAVDKNPSLKPEDLIGSLNLAAAEGHTSTVQALLGKGANINAQDNAGWTALMYAVEGGHLGTVQALLSNGADANAKAESGRTALTIAESKNHTLIVQLLKKQ